MRRASRLEIAVSTSHRLHHGPGSNRQNILQLVRCLKNILQLVRCLKKYLQLVRCLKNILQLVRCLKKYLQLVRFLKNILQLVRFLKKSVTTCKINCYTIYNLKDILLNILQLLKFGKKDFIICKICPEMVIFRPKGLDLANVPLSCNARDTFKFLQFKFYSIGFYKCKFSLNL